jgi:hypothetical protein
MSGRPRITRSVAANYANYGTTTEGKAIRRIQRIRRILREFFCSTATAVGEVTMRPVVPQRFPSYPPNPLNPPNRFFPFRHGCLWGGAVSSSASLAGCTSAPIDPTRTPRASTGEYPGDVTGNARRSARNRARRASRATHARDCRQSRELESLCGIRLKGNARRQSPLEQLEDPAVLVGPRGRADE